MSEVCCKRLAENTGHKKSPFWYHRTNLSGHVFATKACIDNRKKPVKHQYLLHIRLRTVDEFGALQQISTGFAS